VRSLAMALPVAGDLAIPYGRLKTPHGDVLFCMQCADNRRGPTLFTYLHGFYVRCGGDSLRGVLRSLGANCSSSHSRIMCPYCVSCDHDSVHDGFFRLWRSVQLPLAQFADAWAGVDKTGWRSAARAELMEAAEALAHGPRLPMMLGRDGPEGTPASVLLARAKAAAPVPMSAPVGASYVAAQAAHPAMQAASWGIASSATAPPDTECLASAEARLASLEAEVQRMAMFVAALAHELHDVVRRVG